MPAQHHVRRPIARLRPAAGPRQPRHRAARLGPAARRPGPASPGRSASSTSLPVMRSRLQSAPVLLPTWGWPDHNDPETQTIRPEKASRLNPAQAARLALAGQAAARPAPRRGAPGSDPAAAARRGRSIDANLADPATVLEGYQAIAARHQHALDRLRNARQILFRGNVGRRPLRATTTGGSTRSTRSTPPSPTPTSPPRSTPSRRRSWCRSPARPRGPRSRPNGCAEGDRDPAVGSA